MNPTQRILILPPDPTPPGHPLRPARINWKDTESFIMRRDVGVWFRIFTHRPDTRLGQIATWRQMLAERVDEWKWEVKAVKEPPRRDGGKSGYSIYGRKNAQKNPPEKYRAEKRARVTAHLETVRKGEHWVTLRLAGSGERNYRFTRLDEARAWVREWEQADHLPGEQEKRK